LTASTVINNGTPVGTTYSSVVKIVAKDAAGNVTVPSGSDSVTLTATGSAKFSYSFGGPSNSTTLVSGSGTNVAYLSSTDFDSKGAAYIGIYDNTAETVTITPAIIGSLTTPTVATTTVTFKTPTSYIADNTSVAVAPLNTTTTKDSASYYTVPVGTAAGLIITTAATTASAIAQLGIVESSGTTYGDANIIGVTTVTSVAAAATAASSANDNDKMASTSTWPQAPYMNNSAAPLQSIAQVQPHQQTESSTSSKSETAVSVSVPQQLKRSFCGVCGSEIKATFCTSCGTRRED
jgi:hypothetical protein